MRIKLILGGIIIVLLAVLTLFIVSKCRSPHITNSQAEHDQKGRYITIINDTGSVINEAYLTVGEGTEIEETKRKNPDENNIVVKIPQDYNEYDTFTVVLIDRYKNKYEKTESNIPRTGRTEIKVSEEDMVNHSWINDVYEFFNGD